MPVFGLYYRGRALLVRASDRFGAWCDAKTADAYALASPARQRAARAFFQWLGSLAHTAKLLPRLDAVRLVGPQWTAVWVGDPLLARELEVLLFPDDAERHPLPRVAAWSLPRFARKCLDEADVVVCALPRRWPRFWRPSAPVAFTCPVFVNAVMDIRRPIEEIVSGTRGDSLRRQLRIGGQAGLAVRLTASRTDWERFYLQMYRPHVERRHGDRALVSPPDDHWREWIEPGGHLLLLEEDGSPLAGALVRIVGRVCFLGEEGVAQLPRAVEVGYGLRALLRRSAVEYARSSGAAAFVMGRSLARTSDPVLASKLQWGPAIVPPERCLHPEWTFLAAAVADPLRKHLNSQGLIAFTAGRAGVVSIGPPDKVQQHAASKVGHSLVVQAGSRNVLVPTGAAPAEQEPGLPHAWGAGLYYRTRRRTVEIIDRLGLWCDLRTSDAFRLRSPRLRKAVQGACQGAGRLAHVIKLLPRLDAVRLEAPGWSVVSVGDTNLDKELEHLLCPHGASKTPLPRVAAWSLPRFVQEHLRVADLVVCSLPGAWPGVWRPRGPLVVRVPILVEAELDIAAPVGEILRGSAREALRRQLRKSQEAGLQPRLTRERADLERFYREMYVPHVRARHGSRAFVSAFSDHWERWIVPGGRLLLLERDGRPLVGVLLRVVGAVCFAGEEGVAQTDEARDHGYGLRTALRVASIEYARSAGARRFVMGRSLSRGSSHVLMNKLQWGPEIVAARRCLQPEWTFVASRLEGPLRERLNEHGLIALVSGRPCTVSVGEPPAAGFRHAVKTGSVLVVEAGRPHRLIAAGAGPA